MYGSMATGLAYEASDLDLAICGLPLDTRDELIISIEKLSEKLKLDPWVLSCQPIVTARVPIIKLVPFSDTINKKRLSTCPRCVLSHRANHSNWTSPLKLLQKTPQK